MIPAHTILYCSDQSETSIAEAREYIATNNLTADDVRLIKKGDSVLVVTKREIWND